VLRFDLVGSRQIRAVTLGASSIQTELEETGRIVWMINPMMMMMMIRRRQTTR
jgi:hypothetical protein